MTALKRFEVEIDERPREWVEALKTRYCDTGKKLRVHEAMGFLVGV